MAIVEKPRFKRREAEYGTTITSLVESLYLDYTDAGGAQTSAIIVPTSKTVSWRQLPDFKATLVMADQSIVHNATWSRSGSAFKANINATDIDKLTWKIWLPAPWSVKGVKGYNPFPYPCQLVIAGKDAATNTATTVGDVNTYLINGEDGLEVDLVQFMEQAKAAGAAYVEFAFELYNENTALNPAALDLYTGGDGFYLPIPDADPNTGTPYGPSLMFDANNVVDRYGVALAAVAGGLSGMSTDFTTLKQLPGLQSLGVGLGVDATTVAGILTVGLYENWIDMTDIMEYIVPALGATLGPAAVSFLTSRMTSKYTNILGAAGAAGVAGLAGGAAMAGAAWILINMIDDIEVAMEI